MENRDLNTFRLSGLQIEDGFQYGDWRDQWVSDTQYDDCFTAKISLIDNRISKSKSSHTFTATILIYLFLISTKQSL